MEYYMTFGGIGFRIVSDFPIVIEDSFAPFSYPCGEKPNIILEFTRNYSQAPRPSGPMLGQDLLLEYYPGEHGPLVAAKGGWKGWLAVTQCDPDYCQLKCFLNTRDFEPPESLGNLLRYVPMRRILQQHGVLFFHASQIALGNTGILFTAPSGTGKTTQAKLWRDGRGGRIVCNDRALIRDGRTYGYPLDGSEPVGSGEVHRLGAIVLLEQAKENTVQRLGAANAMVRLMTQLVIDTWDSESRAIALKQLMELICVYPVYLLRCTADFDAVTCLERQLAEDGVIPCKQ